MTAIQGGGNASARSGSREARPGAEPWPSLAWQAPRWSAERRAVSAETAAVPRWARPMDGAPVGAPPPFFAREAFGRAWLREWRGKTRARMRRGNGRAAYPPPRSGGGGPRACAVEGASESELRCRCGKIVEARGPSHRTSCGPPSPLSRGDEERAVRELNSVHTHGNHPHEQRQEAKILRLAAA